MADAWYSSACSCPTCIRRLFFDGLTPDQITLLGQLATQVLARLDASTEDVT
jgi:hypothetical protein